MTHLTQNDLAELRLSADKAKCQPGMFDIGQRIHALVDAYEAAEFGTETREELEQQIANRDEDLVAARAALSEIRDSAAPQKNPADIYEMSNAQLIEELSRAREALASIYDTARHAL